MSSSIWTATDGEWLATSPPDARALDRSSLRVLAARVLTGVAVVTAVGRLLLLDSDLGDVARTIQMVSWPVILLLVLGLPLRSLPARRVLALGMTGFFAIPLLVGLTTPLLLQWAGDGNLGPAILVPVVEETLKAVPLLLVFRAEHRNPIRSLTALDLTLVGLAVGAGFTVHEDALWDRLLVGGVEGPFGWLAPYVVLFPVEVVGHTGWTLLVGAGLGLWLVHRRRVPYAWVAPVLGFTLAVVDHAAVNWRGDLDARAWVLDGALARWAGVAAIAAAVTSGLVVRHWAEQRDRVFPTVAPVDADWRGLPARWRYLRQRTGAHTLAYRRLAPGHEVAGLPASALVVAGSASLAGVTPDPSAADGVTPERTPTTTRGAGLLPLVGLVSFVGVAALWVLGPEPVPQQDPALAGTTDDARDLVTPTDDVVGPTDGPPGSPLPDTDAAFDRVAPIAVEYERQPSGRSEFLADDGVRAIFRDPSGVRYAGPGGTVYCVDGVSGQLQCQRVADNGVAPYGARLADVPEGEDETFELFGQRREVRFEERRIAGRDAACALSRLSVDGVEESSELCVDVELGVVLEMVVVAAPGSTFSSTGRTVAVDVRSPEPSDFEIEPEIAELLD